ncbi:Na+/H+ antiporter [Cohnella endophytica]|uniref:Na+/H+ antiporter n=1 Tax=Cohnella endophytica TaxID=2419778 RepID=A0A494XED1_9BACL|nr:Na+/H+ antiporter [Cohnella endophytica]RKP48888.1 Na+/H+ antiporter [Cohnella endophytica]
MELFLAVLVLLLLLAFSQVVQRIFPYVPLPIIQIALGAAVVLFPWHFHVELEPELFFLLFIAPLLFNDGRRTPRDELWKLRTPILLLAVGLVFVTVLVGGYFIHALIPSIPLAASFGLAAILSPTDAVAVSAIASKVHLPKKIHRLLEGESLMNDASGLVAFKFAIAAAVTGAFSLWNATWSFFLIAIGGLIAGGVLAILIIWARAALRRFGIEDASVHVLIQILTPFILFYVAEHLGLSGILAAVAGGVMMAIEQDHSRFTSIEQKFVSEITWSVILFSLNGLVFVLLGVQIPAIAKTIFHDVAHDNLIVIGYVFLLYLLLIALRFGWLTLYSRLAGSLFRLKDDKENVSWKSIWLTSLSGVRGAVTLAGAFTIPLVVGGGGPFPERDLIIFLCAGVILVSLILASIALPLLADRGTGASEESLAREAEFKAQIESIKAANLAIRQAIDGTNNRAAAAVIANNDQRLTDIKRSKYESLSKKAREEELRLRQLGIAEERKCVQLLRENGEIKPEEATVLQNIYNRIEMVYSNRLHIFYLLLYSVVNKVVATFLPKRRGPYSDLKPEDRRKFIALRMTTAKYAINAIQTNQTCSGTTVSRVCAHYQQMINMLNNQLSDPNADEMTEEQVHALEMLSIQAERDALQEQYQQGSIGKQQLSKLQFQISMHEAEVMDSSWTGLLEG